MVAPFILMGTPKIYFGAGKIKDLPGLLKPHGKNVLIVTGSVSYRSNKHITEVFERLKKESITLHFDRIKSEPSPSEIDRIVRRFRNADINTVVSIGGGSAIDTGKAVSAMLPLNGSVHDYLEGIGTKKHPGIKKLFIAIPTTSGTGSEATANSVISQTGKKGFKRSLRHENLIPDIAIVDPELTLNCPPHITAASGMDAFTQLLESYLSDKSNALTNALALDGMHSISSYLYKAYVHGDDVEARSHVSYASLLSGITLANAGLGLIHGFASTIGGMYHIPHGVICGKLMGPVNRHNVQKLYAEQSNEQALSKYACLGRMLSSRSTESHMWYARYAADYIEELTEKMSISNFGRYGLQSADLEKIATATDHKSNPVCFNTDELIEILKACL